MKVCKKFGGSSNSRKLLCHVQIPGNFLTSFQKLHRSLAKPIVVIHTTPIAINGRKSNYTRN